MPEQEKQPEVYLHDYVWMTPPGGGKPEKLPAKDLDELSRRSWQGWTQCDPPSETKSGKGE